MSAYQPKTGAPCSCRPGIERDNCARCEGTGWVVDFAAIRERRMIPERKAYLDNLAELIARDWYRQAVRNPFGKFYLYWRPAKSGEKVAIPIVGTEKPNDEYTRDAYLPTSWTQPRVQTVVFDRMNRLPILGGAA